MSKHKTKSALVSAMVLFEASSRNIIDNTCMKDMFAIPKDKGIWKDNPAVPNRKRRKVKG